MTTEILSLDDPRVAPYASLTEAQLRSRLAPSHAIFIAESPKVIRVAIANGFTPLSLLCERRHVDGDAADIIASHPDMPVYTGTRELLASLTGYTLTRGVLCAMQRPEPLSAGEVCRGAQRIVIIDSVTDTTNIGAIFRSVAALGADGVLLTPTSCDPFNRRAVRVSMGTVFTVPWGWVECPADVRRYGMKTVALALTDRSLDISDPVLAAEPRLAMIMGTEGDGLAPEVIADADYTARIPMSRGIDSLNVAAAAAVAMYALRPR